jgi:hypothetical protein
VAAAVAARRARVDGDTMFVFSKGSGRRGRVRFYWWPLVLSIVISVLITLAINR